MKRFQEQLKKQANSVRLSRAERRDVRERLVSYMEYHPLPSDMRAPAVTRTTTGRVIGYASTAFGSFYIRRGLGAFAVLVLIVVPFAAERSVPGDVLYPVKVRFNEELKSTLSRSPYEQVAWETERLERRLAEARVLASEGKLTPEVEAQVAEAVKQHSDAAQEGIASIRAEDSDEAALAEITFSSALDVQSEMLEDGSSETLSTAVAVARDTAKASQQTSRPSYEKLLARIEQESTSAYELFNTISVNASETERRDIERRLENIETNVEAAKKQKDEDADAAVEALATALADTRKVISFITNIDVRTQVTLDELVPDTETEEEREEAIQARIASVLEMDAVISARLSSVDANTQNAVESRLVEMRSSVEAASSSLAAGETDAADDASRAANAIALEIVAVLDAYDIEVNGGAATTTGTSTNQSGTSTEPHTGTSSSTEEVGAGQ